MNEKDLLINQAWAEYKKFIEPEFAKLQKKLKQIKSL